MDLRKLSKVSDSDEIKYKKGEVVQLKGDNTRGKFAVITSSKSNLVNRPSAVIKEGFVYSVINLDTSEIEKVLSREDVQRNLPEIIHNTSDYGKEYLLKRYKLEGIDK